MLDVEISLRLAIALGWPYEDVHIVKGVVRVPWKSVGKAARPFNYRDPNVIWKIAQKYDAFPAKTPPEDKARGPWSALMGNNKALTRYADTPEKSVAYAIIAYAEHLKRTGRKHGRQLTIASIKKTF